MYKTPEYVTFAPESFNLSLTVGPIIFAPQRIL